MSILVVDDSRVMRQIVIRTLRQAGYGHHDVQEAANGQEGLDAVQASAPSLVLSDWNMPEMTGIEFLAAARAAGCDVPFGFVTSESSEAMKQQAQAAGALFFISKPFTADTFSDTLADVLD